jgi:hypothetical protein
MLKTDEKKMNSCIQKTPYLTYQELSNFDGGGNRSARRKPPVRDPRRKFFLYDATYLVPQGGIEPTPRTDIG